MVKYLVILLLTSVALKRKNVALKNIVLLQVGMIAAALMVTKVFLPKSALLLGYGLVTLPVLLLVLIFLNFKKAQLKPE